MPLPTTDLRISDVKSALGATTNNLSALCTHQNINQWAEHKPGYLYADTTGLREILYHRPQGGASDPYRLGDFRGYYHGAQAPKVSGMESDETINTKKINSGNEVISVQYKLYGRAFMDYIAGPAGGDTYNYAYIRVKNAVGTYMSTISLNSMTPLNTGDTTVSVTLPFDEFDSNKSYYTLLACLSTDNSGNDYVKMPGDREQIITFIHEFPEMSLTWNIYENQPIGDESNWNLYGLDINQNDTWVMENANGSDYDWQVSFKITKNGSPVSGQLSLAELYVNNNAGTLLRDMNPYTSDQIPYSYKTLSPSVYNTLSGTVTDSEISGSDDLALYLTGIHV